MVVNLSLTSMALASGSRGPESHPILFDSPAPETQHSAAIPTERLEDAEIT